MTEMTYPEKLRQGMARLAMHSGAHQPEPGSEPAPEAPTELQWWVPEQKGRLCSVWKPVPKDLLLQYDAGSVYSAVDAEELATLLQPSQADPDVTWVETLDVGPTMLRQGRADAEHRKRVIQYHLPKVEHATLDHLLRFPKGVLSSKQLADHEQLPGWTESDAYVGAEYNRHTMYIYKQERLRRKLTPQELAARAATRAATRLAAGEVSEAALTELWQSLMVERGKWIHQRKPWKYLHLSYPPGHGRAGLMLFIPAITRIIHLMRKTPYRTRAWRKQILALAPALPGLLRHQGNSRYEETRKYQKLAFRTFGRWLREEVQRCKEP